jgi:hypothetical protein
MSETARWRALEGLALREARAAKLDAGWATPRRGCLADSG